MSGDRWRAFRDGLRRLEELDRVPADVLEHRPRCKSCNEPVPFDTTIATLAEYTCGVCGTVQEIKL